MSLKRLLTGQWSINVQKTLAGFLAFFICSAGLLWPTEKLFALSESIPTAQSVFSGSGLAIVGITVIIVGLLRIFFAVLGVIAVFLIMYGGFIWMTAQGDPNKVEKAKQIIYNTIIGLIIIFSSFAIASFIINFLGGLGRGGVGGGTNIPGGNGDWSRSAIGAGPIESVYPRPNQTNVPINTRIAVTFKQDIIPNSICEAGDDNVCNNEKIKNITICEITDSGPDCLTEGEFVESNYIDTTVVQAAPDDFKTFIFNTNKYLGADDGVVRMFKVTLGGGILASSTNESIFKGFRTDYYNWSFKTNGILDLTPPQIVDLGFYPNPDNEADQYIIGSQAVTGSANLTLTTGLKRYSPILLGNSLNPSNPTIYTGAALSRIELKKEVGEVAPDFKVYFNGYVPVSSSVSNFEEYKFTIVSPDCAQVNTPGRWKDNLGVTLKTCGDDDNSLDITNGSRVNTDKGFYFESTGNMPVGSSWSLWIKPEQPGDSLVFKNGDQIVNFLYTDEKAPDIITKRIMGDDGQTLVDTNYYAIKSNDLGQAKNNTVSRLNAILGNLITASISGDNIVMTAKSAGTNQFSFTGSQNVTVDGSLSGEDRITDRTVLPLGSAPDPYNNSIFRVTFNEPISPINIEKSILVNIDGNPVTPFLSLTNEYRTIELKGVHECGLNACGEKMYCWLDPAQNLTPNSIPASIQIYSSRLRFCINGDQNQPDNDWCLRWGGTCNSEDGGGRCKAGDFYYPQSVMGVSNLNALMTAANVASTEEFTLGILDMSNNSFNGNFNKATNPKGFEVGKAEGKTGIGLGQSGFSSPYLANNHMEDSRFTYEADDVTGDDFNWSFFISTQIDRTSPLLTKILPVGDYAFGNLPGENFNQPVQLFFDRLMRMATLKPGWGYGPRTEPVWNIRHLVLKTITAAANPIGYWTGSRDIDYDNDGLADYTRTDLLHNPFDQNVSYGPLAGNGLESITQNCFLPGNGPQNAGDGKIATNPPELTANNCGYQADGTTKGCVTDTALGTSQVSSTNPSSYGYMNCEDIEGAEKCDDNEICRVHWATSSAGAIGSWIITKDYPNATSGRTNCCFGKCL